MKNFRLILGRELAATFYSFPVYVLLTLVAGVTGVGFHLALENSRFEMTFALQGLYGWLFWLTFFLAPLLTMRAFAEEKRSGSLELLMTAPVSDLEVVAGKYVGAVLVFGVFLVPVWIHHLILSTVFHADPDWGQLLSMSSGFLLLGILYLAVGILASALSSAQLWAALLGFVLNTILYGVGATGGAFPADSLWRRFFSYVSLDTHLGTAASGILDLRYVVFEISLAAVILFWTTRVVEARKWR